MIATMLKSRLGNQMFQYAAARALAERHGTEVVLDTTWLVQYNRGGGHARFWLDPFELGAPVRPVWEVARVPNPRRSVYGLQRLRPSRRDFVHILAENTSTMAFEPRVLTAPDNTYLQGYFQFEAYFADHAAAIRDAFAFPPVAGDGERLAERIRGAQAVSVHVRRGDYTGWEMMGFLEPQWFARAVDAVAERVGGVEVYVFSDDPAWCAANLDLGHPTHVVDRDLPDERAWEDMYLMSLCRHHVISNSTFSWWGAWLNPVPDKLVVAPRVWMLNPRREGDPILPSWIRI